MIRIRPAIPSDGKHVLALFRSDKSTWPSGGKMIWWHFWNSPFRTEEWAVAVNGELIVGFVHWARTMDNTRNLYDLAVHPLHRGQGIGRLLVEHIGGPVRCKTDHGSRAELFYKALGFRETLTKPTKTGTKLVTTYELERQPMTCATTGTRILTFTGRWVNPLNLEPEDIHVADIAHALAAVNRFAGHAIKPISVAQHSVYVSRLLEDVSEDLAWEALFHDGSEAYLGDMTFHLKRSPDMAGFRVLEDAAQRAIHQAMGITEPNLNIPKVSMSPEVKAMDQLMVRFEARKAFGRAWQPFDGYPDCTPEEEARIGKWAPWNWRAAEEAFHVQFRRLNGATRVAEAQLFLWAATGGLPVAEAARIAAN